MLRLLSYILKNGTATEKGVCSSQDTQSLGLPDLCLESPCNGKDCDRCSSVCPTSAIDVETTAGSGGKVTLDLGACIACGLCVSVCPTGLIVKNVSTRRAVRKRSDLVLSNVESSEGEAAAEALEPADQLFKRSFTIRVVSTGCSACDLEIGAAFNPIFDIERFGVHLAASPRMADALVVTGPVPRGMHKALKRTYEAMPEPRLVIAAGSCAISGGVHGGGYADANGVDSVLPVDAYIPGCPPHPWSIIHGILTAMQSSAL